MQKTETIYLAPIDGMKGINFCNMADRGAVTTKAEEDAYRAYTHNHLNAIKTCAIALLWGVPMAGIAWTGKVRQWQWLGGTIGGGVVGSLWVFWAINKNQAPRETAWLNEKNTIETTYQSIIQHIVEELPLKKIVAHFNKSHVIHGGSNLFLDKQDEQNQGIWLKWDDQCNQVFEQAVKDLADANLYKRLETLSTQPVPLRFVSVPACQRLARLCQLLVAPKTLNDNLPMRLAFNTLGIAAEDGHMQGTYKLSVIDQQVIHT